MRNIFKTSKNTDGDVILWWSSRGKLMKVMVYTAAMLDSVTEDELEILQVRDAKIFLKGFRKGRYE